MLTPEADVHTLCASTRPGCGVALPARACSVLPVRATCSCARFVAAPFVQHAFACTVPLLVPAA
eukprot:365819-Chlamydomonas_euryale.AAC.5